MTDLYLHAARKEATLRIEKIISDLGDADALVSEAACVYATGSFGRLEAGPNSDLDLFIVVDTKINGEGKKVSIFDGIKEIVLKYHLVQVAENNDVAKFDGGGRFLSSHLIDSYTQWLGSREDDYHNTLTGRMLMLLESRPLVGKSVYDKAVSQALDEYFRDYQGHEVGFIPSFLFNDILRMWRTFCVNYEFYRKVGDSRNKIKNLKLKFSRMLTCYSAIIYLMSVFSKNGTVSPVDVKEMVRISPTERLEAISRKEFWAKEGVAQEIQDLVADAISRYSEFLKLTHEDTRKAVRLYEADEDNWREKSYAFGQRLSKIIDLIGTTSSHSDRLRRLIMI